jgi:L-fuconolactonase
LGAKAREGNMPVVDTHCHVSTVWYEPVESLLFQMDRHGVEHAVLIQMMGQFDNAYQFSCVRRFPGRFAPVVLVDHQRPDAVSTLERLAGEGASGIRLPATARSPGGNALALWQAAARLNVPISCPGTPDDFASPAFADLVSTLPELRLVIEHLGSLGQPRGNPTAEATVDRVMALARFGNVWMKITGLGEYCRRAMPVSQPSPFVPPTPDLLERAVAAFGAERLMWGSDYPPVSSREGYANALQWPRERLALLPIHDVAAIFGGTALTVFALR